MLDLKNILVPIDLSEHSVQALPFAADLARRFGATLVLVHAASGRRAAQKAQGTLERLAANLGGLPARAVLGVASPLELVLELSDKTENPLVLMYTHGRRGLARGVLGSTACQIVSYAHCPVWTVKRADLRLLEQPAEGEAEPGAAVMKIRRILVTTNLKAESMLGVDYAGAFARALGADLMLLHVFRAELPGSGLFDRRRHALKFLEQVGRRVGIPSDQVFLESGSPVRTTVEIARKYGADLIVQATRGPRMVAGLLLGSTSRAVSRRAGCPVLTVRTPENDFLVGEGAKAAAVDEAPAPNLVELART